MARQAARLTIDSEVLEEAKSLKINLSEAAEIGIRAKLRETKAEKWKRENRPSIEAMNRYVEDNGLWSDGRRVF